MKKHGFLYLRITVNPRGFHLILPMKLDESKDETQKHDDPKNAHHITSLQRRNFVSITSSLIPSQIEKMNKRIIMMTTNIPPSSFASSIDLLDNSHRTNNVIKLPPPPFYFEKQRIRKKSAANKTQNAIASSFPHISFESFQHRRISNPKTSKSIT